MRNNDSIHNNNVLSTNLRARRSFRSISLAALAAIVPEKKGFIVNYKILHHAYH